MTAAARNVIPFRRPQEPEQKPRALFSADPRCAGIFFPRTASAAFRDCDYAGWLYHYKRPSWWRRLLGALL